MVGRAEWSYMGWELWDSPVESYDLGQASRRLYFFPTTAETSLMPSSDTSCDLPNW